MLRYLKPVITFIPYVIGCYFAWILRYSKHPDKYPIEERYQKVCGLIKRLNKAMDVEVHVEGKENIPEGVVLFASNHVGNYDPLIIVREADKPVSVVSKIEVESYFFVGKLIKSIEGVFIDRKDLKQSLKEMIVVTHELEEKKKSWLIFPEGTRNRDDKRLLRNFHAGSLKPATKTNTPIVPVVVYGTQRITKLHPHYKKYPVYIEFCPAIYPEQYQDKNPQELADMVREIIQQRLTYKARKNDHEEMIKYNGKKYHI